MRLLCVVQNMWQRFMDLAVVPVETPLPMSMLQRLWSLSSDTDAEATANLLNQLGVMKVACLTDSTAWALVQPGHLKALHVSSTLLLSPASISRFWFYSRTENPCG